MTIEEHDIRDLEEKYGEAVSRNDSGRLVGINQMFFANLYYLACSPLYDLSERKFYLYNSVNGGVEPDLGLAYTTASDWKAPPSL